MTACLTDYPCVHIYVSGFTIECSVLGYRFDLIYNVTLLDPSHHDPTVQSRVRRLIGRRRAGLDRYVGMFRESGQAQDNVDPITELLSQLSSKLDSI